MDTFADAWLLKVGPDQTAAVALSEVLEILFEPDLTPTPAEAYWQHAVAWRDLMLPLVDLSPVFRAHRGRQRARWVAVVAYRTGTTETARFGALRLESPPVSVRVTDDMACELPETSLPEYLAWSFLALSYFRHQGRAVPILDVPLLFSEQAQRRLRRFGTAARSTSGRRDPLPDKELPS